MKTRTVYKTWAVLMNDRIVRTFGDRKLADDYRRRVPDVQVVKLRHVAEFVEAGA